MPFTLGGQPYERAHVSLPRYGVASAVIEMIGTPTLSGYVSLVIGDLTLQGTIIGGGPVDGIATYEWEAGRAQWNRTVIPAKSFLSSIGMRRAVVIDSLETALAEVASPAESVVVSLPDVRLGTHYVRPAGIARDVLDVLGVPWFVDVDGVTRVTERLRGAITVQADQVAWHRGEGRRELALRDEVVSPWLPGGTYEGELVLSSDLSVEASRITVTLTLQKDLRSLLGVLIGQETKRHRFYGRYGYKISAVTTRGWYDLVPNDVTLGLPDLKNVPAYSGIGGHLGKSKEGTKVHVCFEDGDPSKPVAVAYEPPASAPQPYLIKLDANAIHLGEAEQLVARKGDAIDGIKIAVIVKVDGNFEVTFTDANSNGIRLTFPPGIVTPVEPTTIPALLSVQRIDTPGQSKTFA